MIVMIAPAARGRGLTPLPDALLPLRPCAEPKGSRTGEVCRRRLTFVWQGAVSRREDALWPAWGLDLGRNCAAFITRSLKRVFFLRGR